MLGGEAKKLKPDACMHNTWLDAQASDFAGHVCVYVCMRVCMHMCVYASDFAGHACVCMQAISLDKQTISLDMYVCMQAILGADMYASDFAG